MLKVDIVSKIGQKLKGDKCPTGTINQGGIMSCGINVQGTTVRGRQMSKVDRFPNGTIFQEDKCQVGLMSRGKLCVEAIRHGKR